MMEDLLFAFPKAEPGACAGSDIFSVDTAYFGEWGVEFMSLPMCCSLCVDTYEMQGAA